jgi:L-lysine 2,3-aminomutase
MPEYEYLIGLNSTLLIDGTRPKSPIRESLLPRESLRVVNVAGQTSKAAVDLPHRYQLPSLRIEITDRCPLACRHCSISAGPVRRGFMEFAPALSLIDQFAEQGGEEVTVTGGEPLCHPNARELLHQAKSQGLQTTLFSMGITEDGRPVSDDFIKDLVPGALPVCYS